MEPGENAPFEVWAEGLARKCAAKLAQCISPTALLKERSGFAQTVRPAKGSVLASTMSEDPDYFFHWLRDSATVMEAVRILARRPEGRHEWTRRFNEFVTFSLGLRQAGGRAFLERNAGFRDKMDPWFLQYVRPNEEIAAVEGESIAGEARYNADGTLDFIRWNRPQHDGPAARALTCMRFWDDGLIEDQVRAEVKELIRGDLDYTTRFAGEACYDIWEEEPAQHYYTVLVQAAALEKGANWAGDPQYSAKLLEKSRTLRELLDHFWADSNGFLLSRLPNSSTDPGKALDFAVILGVVHAGIASGAYSAADPRVRSTFGKLEQMFREDYAINHGRDLGVIFGRYRGDRYVSGGAYYFSTFGAAEYCYRLAAAIPSEAAQHIAKGDVILSRAREFIPPCGHLSEQFDQTTGAQTSAKDLSWSYACFITALDARLTALAISRTHK